MSTRKTVTEVVHSEYAEDGTWKPKHKTVTTVTETVERDDEGYTWTPRVPRYSFPHFPAQSRFGDYRDFSDRLRDRTTNPRDMDGK